MYIYVKTYAYIFNQIQITLLLELGKVDSYLKELSKFSLKKKELSKFAIRTGAT